MAIVVNHPDGHELGTYTDSEAHDVASKVFLATGERCECVPDDGRDPYHWPLGTDDEVSEAPPKKSKKSKAAEK